MFKSQNWSHFSDNLSLLYNNLIKLFAEHTIIPFEVSNWQCVFSLWALSFRWGFYYLWDVCGGACSILVTQPITPKMQHARVRPGVNWPSCQSKESLKGNLFHFVMLGQEKTKRDSYQLAVWWCLPYTSPSVQKVT